MSEKRARRSLKRKNIIIDQRKLDLAKLELGTKTETATIDAALDMIIFKADIIEAFEKLSEIGGVDYFDEKDRPANDRPDKDRSR